MKKNFPSFFLLLPISLILLFFVSCGPVILTTDENLPPSATLDMLASKEAQTGRTPCPVEDWPCPSDSLTLTAEMKPTLDALLTGTPTCSNWPCPSDSLTLTAEMKPTLDAMLTGTPTCNWPCPNDSLTMTVAMGLTFTAMPSSTSPAWATIIPQAGDLGWGSIYGKITNGVTNFPVEGATVKCEHFSYTSPYPCKGITATNAEGIYSFTGVYFHDTDRITLIVEAPGYNPLHFQEGFLTRPEVHADLGLEPINGGTSTPTPYLMCTAPACSGGVLTCGDPNGCQGGCGTVCLTATPIP
jgi:hypothetical protein